MALRNLVPYNCSVIQQATPDGTLYLTIIEDEDGRPIRLTAEIGKAGSSLRAWTDSFSRMACLLLEQGGNIEQIMDELSNTSSDRSIYSSGSNKSRIRSGPEGIVKAIQKYKDRRAEQFKDIPHGILYNR